MRQRNDEAFNRFYDNAAKLARELKIGSPPSPRYRQPSQHLDWGSQAHQFQTLKNYFRQQYFAACDILIQESTDRFDREEFVRPVQALEMVLLKSANGKTLTRSCKTSGNQFIRSTLHPQVK